MGFWSPPPPPPPLPQLGADFVAAVLFRLLAMVAVATITLFLLWRGLGHVLRVRREGTSERVPLVAEGVPPPVSPTRAGDASLRSELAGLRLTELRTRAKALGVGKELLENAMDSDNPRQALTALLLEHQASERASVGGALRKELVLLRLKEIRSRARQAGVTPEELDEAADSDDPKEAAIELLVAAASRTVVRQPEAEPEPEPALTSTEHPLLIEALKAHQLEDLFENLAEIGVKRVEDLEQLTQEEIDGLQMKRFDRSRFIKAFKQDTPHHGNTSSATVAGFRFEGSKHAMFSYQWDSQEQVLAVRKHFAELGIPTWMDIDGGMQSDIYDSMAQGVSDAAVVVAFMTQRYQDSTNCRLELKYAKQKECPIVPVMLQSGGWRASEWLGIITAGSLWTPLYEASTMQKNLHSLVNQIKVTVPTRPLDSVSGMVGAETAGASEDLHALRSELDTLRADLAKAVKSQRSEHALPTGAGAKIAQIPAEVPPLSLNLRPTDSMRKLKAMLISDLPDNSPLGVTSLKGKVGALGMGGIGKTVTATWLARDDDVRHYFESIVWVTLGQTPDLLKMQSLIYLQATGEDLPADTSPEKAKEKIAVALRGRRVLLVLDDVWEDSHEKDLNFVDVSTASKTLITTRIRGLGGTQIELGMPSLEESVELLLSSAGLQHLQPPPPEAAECVEICGRLPLAVDLAGKILSDFDIGTAGSWAGIPKILRQEMLASADKDDATVEYRVIAASLNAIPLRDREDARAVFNVFALAAEDTHVPMEAFRILLSAITGEAELVPELRVRKLLQLLIKRSLVLGTVERPQLHDITREFSIALFSPQELKRLQRAVVDAFIAARPSPSDPDKCGLGEWNDVFGTAVGDACEYVAVELHHHVKEAISVASLGSSDRGTEADCESETTLRAWLRYYPHDGICHAIGQALGARRCFELASRAEIAKDYVVGFEARLTGYWETYRVGGVAAVFVGESGKLIRAQIRAAFRCLGRVNIDARPSSWSTTQWELWQLNTRNDLLSYRGWLKPSSDKDSEEQDQIDLHSENIKEFAALVESTSVGRTQLGFAEKLSWLADVEPLYLAGNVDAGDPILLERWQKKAEVFLALQNPEQDKPELHVFFSHMKNAGFPNTCNSRCLPCLLRLSGWRWDVFGTDCALAAQAFTIPDGQKIDWLGNGSEYFVALRGNLASANAAIDNNMEAIRQWSKDWQLGELQRSATASPDCVLQLVAAQFLPTVLFSLRRQQEAAEILELLGITWDTADDVANHLATETSWIYDWRARGTAPNADASHQLSVDGWSWTAKLGYVLCSDQDLAVEVTASLPAPETLESYVLRTQHMRGMFTNVFLLAAQVCEKFERYTDALLYIARAVCYNPTSGNKDYGDHAADARPTTHGIANALHGRVLAKLGRRMEAQAAFEAAVEVSHAHGLWLLEMLALRDLKRHVLDEIGRGGEGTARLKVVLQRMKGPATELTKLLGGGMDAEQILRT